MNPPEPSGLTSLVRRLRRLEIRIRKAVQAQLQGNFHSVFKGTGLDFDDVRLYQYGDDVRAIDWAVSSKGHGTFIKTYKEEKEQQVLVLLDVSASLDVGGGGGPRKLDVARDLAGLLALAAAQQDSPLGLLAFSDQKELYLPPAKGLRAAYFLIRQLFALVPASRHTGVGAGIRQALGLLKRRSLVLLISDFIDLAYERELTTLARQHDLIVVQLLAPRERRFPALGIVPLRDAETGAVAWVNTSSAAFRARHEARALAQETQIASICRRHRTGFLRLSTEGDFVPQLVGLFRQRNRRAA